MRKKVRNVSLVSLTANRCTMETRACENAPSLFDNLDEWLTTEEAAAYLRLTTGSLRNMVCVGQISCYKLGRRNRFSKGELRNLLIKKNRGGFHGH